MLIYTDGSSSPGGRGPGGWAFVVVGDEGDEATVHEAFGYGADTTNNRMEMTAIIEAMRWAQSRRCVIHSDSQLCVNTITLWAEGWRRRGWRKADGSEPMNIDLVVMARNLYLAGHFDVKWVRGHAGNIFNERADELAGLARTSGACGSLDHRAPLLRPSPRRGQTY